MSMMASSSRTAAGEGIPVREPGAARPVVARGALGGVGRTVVTCGGEQLREQDREDDLAGGSRVRAGAGAQA
jgi:hypothetical protein